MKTLGQTIEATRKARRISVIALAKALGVTRAAVYQWQRDEHAPTLSNLIELSRILGVPLTVFAAAVDGIESVDAELMQLPPDHASALSRSFRDQIETLRKLQKT